MQLSDIFSGLLIRLIFGLFEIYLFFAGIVLHIFFPVTKWLVERKLKSFGLVIDGPRPIDIKVINERRFYIRSALEGTLGLFESRMDGDWTNEDFIGLIRAIISTRRLNEISHPLTWALRFFNLQTKARAFEVGTKHYDDACEAIKSMMDKNMQYTCGYWKDASNLEDSQIAKLELVAKKLKLKPGMRVLELGCGFGALAYHLAKNYGVSVVGCSVSKESNKYAEELCKGYKCEFRLCDYRDMDEKFDRVVSIGMLEHVGLQNYRTFFDVCNRNLKDDGILLFHCIGNAHKCQTTADAWVHKYIFPNGYVPYYMELNRAFEGNWILEDWHNFGFDYSKTLEAWEVNFDKAWPRLEKMYGDRFHTMWKMYLQMSQACFFERTLQLWQVVLSKDGLPGGYHSPR